MNPQKYQHCAKYNVNDLCDIDDQESCKCDTVWNLSCRFIGGTKQHRCIIVNDAQMHHHAQNPGFLLSSGLPHGPEIPQDSLLTPAVNVAEPSTKLPPTRKHPQKPGRKRRQRRKAKILRKSRRIFTW